MATSIVPGPYSVEGFDGGRLALVDGSDAVVFSTFEPRNQVENICSAMNALHQELGQLRYETAVRLDALSKRIDEMEGQGAK